MKPLDDILRVIANEGAGSLDLVQRAKDTMGVVRRAEDTLRLLDRAEREGVLEGHLGTPEIRAIHEDLEYFRVKPAKNWRIRAPLPNEKVLIRGQISPTNIQLLVFRQRQAGDGFIFFKTAVTTGPHNDLADPWLYIRKGALRASAVWRYFLAATANNDSHDAFLETLDRIATSDTRAFELWCLEDIERAARLAWANSENQPGPKVWDFWGENEKTILIPDRALIDAVHGLDESLPMLLPRPSFIVVLGSNQGVHGYLFVHNERVFQVCEFGTCASTIMELVEPVSWNEIAEQIDVSDGFKSPEAALCALSVLNDYLGHLRRGGKPARDVGIEILPPITKELPVSKSPVETILAQIQAAYDSRIVAHTKRIAEFRKAVNEGIDIYAAAAEQDLLVDFAVKNGVENAGELRAGPAADHLLELIGRLPELGGKERVETAAYQRVTLPEVEAVEIEEGPVVGEFATLQSFITGGCELLIVGGTPVQAKLNWLELELGLPASWIDTENDPDSRGCERIANRMKEPSNLVAVLFCQAFMSHVQTKTLIEAGREHHIQVHACGRAGKGEILRALRAVERAL